MADRAAVAMGVLAALERRASGSLAVLTYHRVLPDERCAAYPFPSLATPRSMFEAQVALLSSRYDVRPASEAIACLRARARRARPLLAITFDDGYADNADIAAPILDRSGMRASFYVVAGLVGTPTEPWFDVAARRFDAASVPERTRAAEGSSARAGGDRRAWIEHLKRLSPAARDRLIDSLAEPARGDRHALDRIMTSEELRTLARRGHEIGSHTLTHPILPGVDDEMLAREMTESRAALARLAGVDERSIAGICYPNGDFDSRVERAAADAGYAYALSTRPGLNAAVGLDASGARAGLPTLRRIDMNPSRFTGDVARAMRAELCLFRGWFR